MTHLHVHSEYSIGDGASTCEALVRRAKNVLGHSALAITDHDGLYGAVDFCRACRAHSITPILGAEMRVVDNWREKNTGYHTTILALNQEGYTNLCNLTSEAWTTGFYQVPRIQRSRLLENSAGLVLLSGCAYGYFAQLWKLGQQETISKWTNEYREAFGDHFFLELYNDPSPAGAETRAVIMQASQAHSVPLVGTADAHFVDPSEYEVARLMRQIRLDDSLATVPDSLYLLDDAAMAALYPQEALENTDLIASWADFALDLATDERGNIVLSKVLERIPKPPMPEGMTEMGALKQILRENWRDKLWFLVNKTPEDAQVYYDRITMELDVIEQTGFTGYMLVVQDICRFCRERGILMGPGRGSGSGSLICYVLGITGLDPIASGLYFERFLDPGRAAPPDIDLDFDDSRRDEVFKYLQDTYGRDNVGKIITFNRFQDKGAAKSIAKIMGVSYAAVNELTQAIKKDFNEIPENKEAQAIIAKYEGLADVVERSKLIATAKVGDKKVKGRVSQVGAHAAGVVITPRPLYEISPQQPTRKGDPVHVVQFDMKHVEALGFLKVDVLSLSTLAMAQQCIDIIKDRRGIELDWYTIPIDDEPSYEMARRGQTTAIFQLENGGMQRALKSIGPTNVMDLAVVEALYRPGPMDYIPDYAAGKQDPNVVVYDMPEFRPILADTYGVFVYQEQVIAALRALGFSFTEADEVRRGIGKKDMNLIAQSRAQFIQAAAERGHSEVLADMVWAKYEKFAGYAFNKAHAVAYAVISARMLYLKSHYPAEFMAAALTHMDKDEYFIRYIAELPRLGVKLLSPCINRSTDSFSCEDEGVRFGLAHIKNLGNTVIDQVRWMVKAGMKFDSPLDAASQLNLSKTQFESLSWAGAFDSFGVNRTTLVKNMETILQLARTKDGSMDSMLSWDDIVADFSQAQDDDDNIVAKEEEFLKCSPSNILFDGEVHQRLAPNSTTVSMLVPGEKKVEVAGRIVDMGSGTSKREKEFVRFTLADGTGNMTCLAFGKKERETLLEAGPGCGIHLTGDMAADAIFVSNIVTIDTGEQD